MGSSHHNNGDRLIHEHRVLCAHLPPPAPSPRCARYLYLYHANSRAPERLRHKHHSRPSPPLPETDTTSSTRFQLTLAVYTMATVPYPTSNNTAIMPDHAPPSRKRPDRHGHFLKTEFSLLMYIENIKTCPHSPLRTNT